MSDELVYIVDVGGEVPCIIQTCAKESAESVLLNLQKKAREESSIFLELADHFPESAEYWKQRSETERRARLIIVDMDKWEETERNAILNGKMEEITKEEYKKKLEVRPQVESGTWNEVEEFCVCGMFTGAYAIQYAHDKQTDKYYSKLVSLRDRSTWIDRILRNGGKNDG